MFAQNTLKNKTFITAAGLSMGVLAGLTIKNSIQNSGEDHIPSLDIGWSHHGAMQSFDTAAIRRGFQVYRQVCSTCHSVERVAFRSLVGVSHNEHDMKKIAESYEIEDGPDDNGEMFERPGKLSDAIPSPYKNEEQGRMANGGALPPDLSLLVKARHYGIDYIFSLLVGYTDSPEGKAMLPGLYYNPYFPGGAIAMPAPLQDGQVDYEDGTPATVSQMAKDVSIFLAWASEPEHDDRKRSGIQWMLAVGIGLAITAYYKRFRWSILKTRKITYAQKK